MLKKNRIAIVHFQPLEHYPPVMNFLDYLASQADLKVLVITTDSNVEKLEEYTALSDSIIVKRLGRIKKKAGVISRAFHYLRFNLGCLFYLTCKKRQSVVYFETLSSFPVYLYKKYLRFKTRIFIHYHEYTSPDEYAKGMKLNKFFHHRESWLYKHAHWISHTNEERLDFFKQDENLHNTNILHILPNYPPLKWKRLNATRGLTNPLKVIYVGAIGLDTMYVSEFTNWVRSQNGCVQWDIYSFNMTDEAVSFFSNEPAVDRGLIKIYEGVSYQKLPGILQHYDVGVILYKGHIPNYVFNAPNKLFEYLACGLDVWFPDVMLGIKPYMGDSKSPQIINIDFNNLQNFNIKKAFGEKDKKEMHSFFAEDVLAPLLDHLKNECYV